MWKYANQIKIRWVSFIIGLILLTGFLLYINKDIPISQTGMKVILTRAQVTFESLPVWYYAIIVLVNTVILLIGAPSICVILPLMILKDCTFAFIVTASCQILTTLIAMWISYNFGNQEISELLKTKLSKNKDNFQSFAFWSRLYYNIPLRTIDSLTFFVHNKAESFYNSLIAASCAIMIRLCIPTMLTKHIIAQFTLLEPNPQLEENKLLIWGCVLLAYTILPKTPELMICPDAVKTVIFEIESPTLPSSKEKLMKEIEAKTQEEQTKETEKKETNTEQNTN